MTVINYEACYAARQLTFGAGVKEVNERWRKLSRVHHPDRHARDPNAYQQAPEKQKQLNNARDILKNWFELNPHAMPPRSNPNPGSTNTQSKSTDPNTSQACANTHAATSIPARKGSSASWRSRSRSAKPNAGPRTCSSTSHRRSREQIMQPAIRSSRHYQPKSKQQ